jgi:DNA-binding beta-propeller fold protein YncE
MGLDGSLQVFTINIKAYAINPGSGTLSAVAGRPVAPVGYPDGLAIDPTGRFAYVASSSPDVVSAYAINAGSGAWTAVPGSPFAIGIATGLGGAHSGVAVDPAGKFVYVTNFAGLSPQINPSNNVLGVHHQRQQRGSDTSARFTIHGAIFAFGDSHP